MSIIFAFWYFNRKSRYVNASCTEPFSPATGNPERPISNMGQRIIHVVERIFHMENLISRIEKNIIRPGTIPNKKIPELLFNPFNRFIPTDNPVDHVILPTNPAH